MPYPATRPALAESFSKTHKLIAESFQEVGGLWAQSASSDLPRRRFLELRELLDNALDSIARTGQYDTVVAYAQQQLGDDQLNVVVEFIVMRDEMIALRDWITNNFPLDENGDPEIEGPEGEVLVFTVAQLASFRTQADSFIQSVS